MNDPRPSEDLLARIHASLENEQHADGAPWRFDPAFRRPRRRRRGVVGVLTGGLAAAVVAPLVAGHVLTGDVAARTQAALVGAPDAQAGQTSETAGPLALTGPAPAGSGSSTPVGSVHVVASGTTYHRGHLSGQAEHLTRTWQDATDAAGVVDRPTLAACLAALSWRGDALADVAQFDGRPALVLVRPGDGASRTATLAVVPRTCGTRHITPLVGPVTIELRTTEQPAPARG